MSNLITKENMERQISEMWVAGHNIPLNDLNRAPACDQAFKTEADLREMYRKQEQLRDTAPDLLECLQLVLGSFALEKTERFDLIEKCKETIKKAES
jgi:hypothetical protein